jgi:hypothetical protein
MAATLNAQDLVAPSAPARRAGIMIKQVEEAFLRCLRAIKPLPKWRAWTTTLIRPADAQF